MIYPGVCCSNLMNSFYMASRFDFAVAQRFPRLAVSYEIPSAPLPQALPLPHPLPATLSPQIRVLVAGDHATLRSSLKTMLELDPRITVVGEAADDCETVKMARKLRPDVVLIDLDMRCCDDYEAVAEITQRALAKAIVGLTIYDDEGDRARAQAAGVSSFLEKGVPYKQLINTIRTLAAEQQSSEAPKSQAAPQL